MIRDAMNGSCEAFGRLVRRYQDRLYHTLFHLIGSVHDAQDASQDAFVQAYLKLDTFQQDSKFFTWLYRIALNTWISRSRKKRPIPRSDHLEAGRSNEPTDNQDEPAGRLEHQEDVELVRRALGRLSEEFRTVLLLREFEGFSYEEISEILDLPLGTVRSRLCRARIQLRNHILTMSPKRGW